MAVTDIKGEVTENKANISLNFTYRSISAVDSQRYNATSGRQPGLRSQIHSLIRLTAGHMSDGIFSHTSSACVRLP